MRKQIILATGLLIVLLLISIVSAEIMLSQPKALYNLGEDIEISATVKPTRDTSDFLKLSLNCGGNEKDFYFSFLKLSTNQEKSITESVSLTKSFLSDMKGDCKIKAVYAENSAETQGFVISDKIDVKSESNTLNYLPGEEVVVKGEAIKENSQALNGFAEISFLEAGLTTSSVVSEGKFEIKFVLPENIAAGSYSITAKAYEKEPNGEESNKGEDVLIVNIKKVPRKVDIALSQQEIKPGNSLEFKIILYDQSENPIEGEASFRIENSKEKLILEKLTEINKNEIFYLEKNLTSGYYKIKAYSSGIRGERQFYVEENKEAEFRIINGSLIIQNIGNVKYDKSIEVKIGEETRVIDIELEKEQQREYEISAPEGNYEVVVTDGATKITQGGVVLSGQAVSIREVGGTIFSRNKYLAWGFIIFVLGFFVFMASRRVLKRKFIVSAPSTEKTRSGVIKLGKKEKEQEDKQKGSFDKTGSKETGTAVNYGKIQAEHSLILHGQKQDIALICLKIKNPIGKESEKNLEHAFAQAYEIRAAKYKTGDYICLIFSPLVTRTFKNYDNAVRAALGISKSLEEYNRKFKEKISYGISVHSGTIVNTFQNNVLKFTSLGNTLGKAKKLAEISQGEVLLSKELHEKTLADVKAEKQVKDGIEVFTVNRITDSEKNKKFIHDFLERLDEEKKRK